MRVKNQETHIPRRSFHIPDFFPLVTRLLSSPARYPSFIARHLPFVICLLCLASCLSIAGPNPPNRASYDGADWHLKGEGVECCPCAVPCPCRSNSGPTYRHCESTLYVRVKQGYYGNVRLDDLQMVESGGMCANSHRQFSALYLGRSASPAQQSALMKLIASVTPGGTVSFAHVRVVPIHMEVTGDHLFNMSIPGILEMIVDRNWGQSSPPMPMVAAVDYYSNEIEYIQNIRYRMHDLKAGMNFDYSHRQANYRIVDMGVDRYRSAVMLLQFEDGKGWFNAQQMELIKEQHLTLPQLDAIRKQALRLGEP